MLSVDGGGVAAVAVVDLTFVSFFFVSGFGGVAFFYDESKSCPNRDGQQQHLVQL